MEIDYELTQQDFTEAYSAHRRNAPTKWVSLIAFWLVIAVASFLLYSTIHAHNSRASWPFFVLAILLAVIGGALPRWSIRKQYTKQPGAHGPRKLTLDASGTHWRWNGGSGDVEWKNYIRTVEGEKQILLYTSPASFNILPKRALNSDQLSKLRTILAQNIQAVK